MSGPVNPSELRQAPTEVALLALAQSGDASAFAMLFQPYRDPLLRTAMRLLHSRDDALDVLQEVALTLYQKLDDIDPDGNLGGWLYKVTVNACYRWMRRNIPIESIETQEQRVSATQESTITTLELGEVLARCMGRLSPQERTAFVLRDLEGLDGPAIADAMQCKATTARGYYFAARNKLAAIISQEYPEWRESITGAQHDTQ